MPFYPVRIKSEEMIEMMMQLDHLCSWELLDTTSEGQQPGDAERSDS